MSADLTRKAELLRRLHRGAHPLVLLNVWDVASARLVERAGFPVIATSSGAVAASLGYEDNNTMPADEAFAAVGRIARNVSVPVTADMEAGYGLSPKEFVGGLLEAGAVGCNLEDTDHETGSSLVDADEQVTWLRAVRGAADDFGVPIVVNARVDALRFEGDPAELLAECVRRAGLYLEAGADCVFPIRLSDEKLIADFVDRVKGPVNILARGAPPIARLAQLGVARVSFAGDLMRQAYGSIEATIAELAVEIAGL